MKKTTLRRLFAAIVSIVMMLSMCVVNVGAEPTFPQDNNNGSITINKYATDGTTPVNGVEFSIIKVADAVQYSVSSTEGATTTTTTGLGFTLVEGVNIFGTMEPEKDAEGTNIQVDGKNVYSANTLQTALDGLTKDDEGKLVNPPAWTNTGATSNGSVTFGNLGFGIYLIDETYIGGTEGKPVTDADGNEVDVYRATGPYLVSVPTTDNGNTWNTAIEIDAKNIVTAEHVEKTASFGEDVEGEGNVSVGIGEDFTYTISADILRTNDDSKYTQYAVTDNAGSGITIDLDTIAVKYNGATFDAATGTMTKGTHYTVDEPADEGDPTFTITLTDEGLALINAVTADTKLFVQYTAQLNSNATSGSAEAKRNEVGLTYNHNNQGEQEDPNPDPSDVYTYDIDLTKLFENAAPNGIDATAVTFELYEEDGTTQRFGAIPAAPSQAESAEYVIDNSAAAAAEVDMTGMTAGSATGQFACNAEGKLLIRGLANGTYQLKEITTVDGYSLLKENVTVTIDDGNATISINNESESIFTLPLTGGSGTWIYTVGGMALMGMAVVLLVTLGKKKTA